MIIYKDMVTDTELFSDSFKLKEIEDGFIYEIDVKMVTKSADQIDASAFGGNPSAEGEDADDTDDSAVETGLDIAMYHKLQNLDDSQLISNKKGLQGYLKKFVQKTVKHLEDKQTDADTVTKLKKDVSTNIKKFMDLYNEDNSSIFLGNECEFGDYTCNPGLFLWSDDGKGGKMYYMKPFPSRRKYKPSCQKQRRRTQLSSSASE